MNAVFYTVPILHSSHPDWLDVCQSVNKTEWSGDDKYYREKQSRSRGEEVPGWGSFVNFSRLVREDLTARVNWREKGRKLCWHLEEESSKQREEQVQSPGDRNMPGVFFMHLLEFSLAFFTVTSTIYFPILGHPNILGIHIQTLVTTGSLFYSQYPNGDQIILILLTTHYKFFCFSIFPLSPYQPYNDRNYRILGL